MKNFNKLLVILSAVCAIISIIQIILNIAFGTYNDSAVIFVLNLLCAILWTAAFILNLKVYRSKKEKM